MRTVLVGDPHFDVVTLGVARFDEVARAMHETVDCAVGMHADLWVCLGDVFDPDAGPVSYRAISEILRVAWRLRLAGIASVWVAGNHDVVEDGTGTTTLSPLRAMSEAPGATTVLVERPTVIHTGGPPIVALPYTATSHAYDAAKYVEEQALPGSVVLGHLVVPGVSPGEEAVEYARGREVFFPVEAAKKRRPLLMANGHHHKRQTSADGVVIPGSLARLTFGEAAHDPGYVVAEV